MELNSPQDDAELIANLEGPDFEDRLRADGIPLPSDISGADILRVVFQQIFQDLTEDDHDSLSNGAQFGLSPIRTLIQQLDRELPRGNRDPAFRDLLLSRVREWAASKRGQTP